MSELIHANTYIINAQGRVLGVGYTNAEDDTSTYIDELGFEKIPEANNRNLLKLTETKVNLLGEKLKEILGEDYPQSGKYHMFIPSVCGGKRIGTILLAKYGAAFTDEDVALGEYGATVVGLEMMRSVNEENAEENRKIQIVKSAISTLSFSELEAIIHIFDELEGEEGILVASKIADRVGITRSVIVNALRKFESAGVIESRSSGMKGTYIKVLNDAVFDELDKVRRNS